MTKFLLSIGLTIFSSIALARPLPQPLETGIFLMDGFKVLSKKHFVTVHAGREPKRLQELRKQKYQCVHGTQNMYKCTKFLDTVGSEHEVEKAIKSQYLHQPLITKYLRGPIELIAEGQELLEWAVPQKASFGGFSYDSYRIIESMGLTKVFLGEDADFTFIILDDQKIALSVIISRTETPQSSFSYLIGVDYSVQR